MTWLMLLLAFDLAAVKAEPDPVKRANRALDYAFEQLAEARKLTSDGSAEALKSTAEQVTAGIDLMVETFGQARRRTSDLKKAELRLRDLIRRLETLRQDAPFEERAVIEAVETRARASNEKLLELVMGKR
ncbi:MAG: hypothetical protein NTZ56_03660 [Acidobacteria bacterium]|nr:hypothetical protein [Acidobacteriota bacterium]